MSIGTNHPPTKSFKKNYVKKLRTILKNSILLMLLGVHGPSHAGVIGCDTTERHAKYMPRGIIIESSDFSPVLNSRLRVFFEGYYSRGGIRSYQVTRNGSSNIELSTSNSVGKVGKIALSKSFSGDWRYKSGSKILGKCKIYNSDSEIPFLRSYPLSPYLEDKKPKVWPKLPKKVHIKKKPKEILYDCNTDVQYCTNGFVCDRITNTKYLDEGKKRGLSCLPEIISKPKSQPVLTITDPKPKSRPVVVKPDPKPELSVSEGLLLSNPFHFERYGKTLVTPLLEGVMVFLGDIEDGDQKGFRKALRQHKIETVVLISNGGLVYTGLDLANIIYDNDLRTYIPVGKTCASACSFMFFAGTTKVAHGALGVHQFYSENEEQKMAVGMVQKNTQYLVADIIEALEDFDTPASVYPKMFSTAGMYFFSEEEKSEFKDEQLDSKLLDRINAVLGYLVKYLDNEIDESLLNQMSNNMKNNLTQLELIRIGCLIGPADGVKGEATKSALGLLSAKLGKDFSNNSFSDLFMALNNTEVGSCY